MSVSWNIVTDHREMLSYAFMLHAFEAGTAIAALGGLVGYLVLLRRSAFAAHALAHSGFAGGAGAVLLGINPVFGLLLFTSGSGVGMALLGRRASERDMEIGTVLAFMLGLGLLFTNLYRGGVATAVYSLLFGEILGISASAVLLTIGMCLALLAVLAIVYRPILFSALDEDVAAAKGLPTLGVNLIFLLLVAVTVSMAIQVVGVLLIFSLMVTPAAIGLLLSSVPARAVAISGAVAVLSTWIALFVAWYEPYPVSFFLTTFVFGLYLVVRAAVALRARWATRTAVELPAPAPTE